MHLWCIVSWVQYIFGVAPLFHALLALSRRLATAVAHLLKLNIDTYNCWTVVAFLHFLSCKFLPNKIAKPSLTHCWWWKGLCLAVKWQQFQMGNDYDNFQGSGSGGQHAPTGRHGAPRILQSCFSGTSTVQTRRGVIKNAIRDGCSTMEYCLIWENIWLF